MEHFSEQAWADFVRGFRNCDCEEMGAHLARHCVDCTRIHHTWELVYSVAQQASLHAPPESLARMAKLEFASRLQAEAAPAVFAALTFDTFARPALAGVRSPAASARQMLYEAEGLAVDLRFDRAPNRRLVTVTGQVLDRRQPRVPLESVLVIVWTPKGLPIIETRANAFGEFNLQLEPLNNLRLSIQAVGQKPVSISLANLGPESHSDEFDSQRW
jgi:hypothetical protein